MPTVTVSLPTDIVAFIEGEIAAGGYETASDVVRDSLRRLQQAKAADDGTLAVLRREVGIGIEQARAGRFSDRSVADVVAAVCGSIGTGSVASIRPACGNDADVARSTSET